jgi:hypothetical protein
MSAGWRVGGEPARIGDGAGPSRTAPPSWPDALRCVHLCGGLRGADIRVITRGTTIRRRRPGGRTGRSRTWWPGGGSRPSVRSRHGDASPWRVRHGWRAAVPVLDASFGKADRADPRGTSDPHGPVAEGRGGLHAGLPQCLPRHHPSVAVRSCAAWTRNRVPADLAGRAPTAARFRRCPVPAAPSGRLLGLSGSASRSPCRTPFRCGRPGRCGGAPPGGKSGGRSGG